MKKEEHSLNLHDELQDIKAQMKTVLEKLEESEKRSKKLAFKLLIPVCLTLFTTVGVMLMSTLDGMLGTDMAANVPEEEVEHLAENKDGANTETANIEAVLENGEVPPELAAITDVATAVTENATTNTNKPLEGWGIVGGAFNTLHYAQIEKDRLNKYFKDDLFIIKNKNKYRLIISNHPSVESAMDNLTELNDLGAVVNPYIIKIGDFCDGTKHTKEYVECDKLI